MRIAAAIAVLSLGLAAAPRPGAADPVVVELFTSQGCSACPPADALLRDLGEDPGILPLALHVDYWDYLGWSDSFAFPAATRRQKSYAEAAGETMVFTPQMIVGGQVSVAGFKPGKVLSAIMAARAAPDRVSISVARAGDGQVGLRIEAVAPFAASAEVVLVRYRDSARVDIRSGENAGRSVTYSNIVTEWSVLEVWDGTTPLVTEAALAPPLSSAVLVQAAGPGEVLGAARLD